MNDIFVPPTFEAQVRAVTNTPRPRPEFVEGLWRQMVAQPVTKPSLGERLGTLFRRPAWIAAAIVALAVVGLLVAVGPQRVLAQVQSWLGYVPGIGFADLEQARVLVAPVDVQREGVTLRIEQALSDPDRTVVVITSHGLPVMPTVQRSSPSDPLPEPVLRLPDGSTLKVRRQDLHYGGGKMEFPALPEDVYQILFEIDRLPLVPPGGAPEDWQAPLALHPATGELPTGLFPQPYTPEGVTAVANGVRAQLLQVAQSSEETALQVRFEWDNAAWDGLSVWYPPELQDDRGNIYHPVSDRVTSAVVQEAVIEETAPSSEATGTPNSTQTFTFPTLSLVTREAVLRLSSLEFAIPDTAVFLFNPGPNTQLGQTWPLDEQLEVGGIPLTLVGARLDRDKQTFPGKQEPFYSLEFTFRTIPGLPQALTVLSLRTDTADYRGGGGGSPEPGLFKIEMLFEEIPTQPVNVTIERARIRLEGPWEMRWEIPRVGETVEENRSKNLEGVEDIRLGVMLQVTEASFDSQLSVVQLAVPGLPADSRLMTILDSDPSRSSFLEESQLYLESPQGQRVGLAQNVTRLPTDPSQEGPDRLVFGPVSPIPDRITLHIPAIELFVNGQAAFEVDVPAGLAFYSEEVRVPNLGLDSGQQETVQTRWVSDPWEVDIPVEVAGYRLRFTQAQVEQDLNGNPAYRLTLTSQPLSRELEGKSFSAFHLAGLTRPDGQSGSVETVNELMRWFGLYYDRLLTEDYDPARWNAKIFLDVTTPNGLELLPGTYRVEIDGASLWAAGPWELSWSLSGN